MKIPPPVFFAGLVLAVSPVAFAQRAPRVPAGPPAGASSAAAPSGASASPVSSAGASSVNAGENDKMWDLADKIINSDSLNIDSENGVFQWNNSKFDIGNNLLVRTRFERYLTYPADPDSVHAYQAVLQNIQDLLSNDVPETLTEQQKSDRVFQAWQLLAVAAKYPEDGGASLTLANQVFNAWRSRDELADNKDQYDYLQKKIELLRKGLDSTETANQVKAQDAIMDGYQTAMPQGNSSKIQPNKTQAGNAISGGNQTTYTPNQNNGNSNSGGNTGSGNNSGINSLLGGDPTGGALNNVMSSGSFGGNTGLNNTQTITGANTSFQVNDLSRAMIQQNLVDAQSAAIGVQSKLSYQTQLLAFIGERRFLHSLMAGQFYEHIFKGSQQNVQVAQDEISRYFDSKNVVPSVNSFEFISHEAISDVDTSMKSVESSYDSGDRWTALEQLQQAFLLGEMLPSVQQFDPAKRKVLLSLYREAQDMRHLIDIRDYAAAEDVLKKIQDEAKDFEAAPVLSAIKEAEQTSNNFVLAAGQAAAAGNSDQIAANLQQATQYWPLNPEIGNFSNSIIKRANLQSEGKQKFDDLMAKGDDRAIYDLRDELGLAVFQDPDDAAKLKAVLDRVSKVEMAIAFSDQAMKQNNGYAAWEALQSAADIEPNDPVLARTMRDVAPRVANFVAALDSADRAAKDGNYADALNFYLQAQDIYPASNICSTAITDLSAKLMAKLNPKGATATALNVKAAQAAGSATVPSAQPAGSAPVGGPPSATPAASGDSNKTASN